MLANEIQREVTEYHAKSYGQNNGNSKQNPTHSYSKSYSLSTKDRICAILEQFESCRNFKIFVLIPSDKPIVYSSESMHSHGEK